MTNGTSIKIMQKNGGGAEKPLTVKLLEPQLKAIKTKWIVSRMPKDTAIKISYL